MQIPPVTDPCWLRLAQGELALLRPRSLGAQLFIERMTHSNDPPSLKASEIFGFFSAWAHDMPDELAQIRQW